MMLKRFQLLFLCLLITGTQKYAAGSPIMGYEYIQDSDVWLHLHVQPATWPDARLRCHLEGGVLASPTTNDLAAEMKRMLAAHNLMMRSVYVGINAVVSKGHFTTMDGIPLANTSVQWAYGEPNNENNAEDCVVMNGAGKLVDLPCTSVHPFFCKKKSEKMTVNDCGITDTGYKMEPRTGSCYKFHLVPRTWHQAAAACSAEGGHLAIINSATESQVLKKLFAEHPDNTIRGAKYTHVAMIGFWDWNEHARNAEWLTIFGETLSDAGFDVWARNEPKNAFGVEFCGSIDRDGLLNDFECERSAVFICEITPL